MPRDTIDAKIIFSEGWEQDGTGADGLPLFKPVIMIRKVTFDRLTDITAVAEEQDFEEFAEEWHAFEKARAARTTVEGYPLAMWPVISPSELQMLLARDIVTVEQLAKLADRRSDDVIPAIKELAKRAKKLVELQGKVGKFEAIIDDLTKQRDTAIEQLREANMTISQQNAQLNRKVA